MTTQEFKECFKLAEERCEKEIPLQDLSIFDGFGLANFEKVTVTKSQVADLIRYQTFYMFGEGCDNEALQEIRNCGRYNFIIV